MMKLLFFEAHMASTRWRASIIYKETLIPPKKTYPWISDFV